MKQQALAIAAATMLTIGLGIANAEQIEVLDQGVSPEIAACGSDQNPCVPEMINEGSQVSELSAGAGPDLEQQDVMNESSDENEANEAEDQEMAMAETSDESNVPGVIIFLE